MATETRTEQQQKQTNKQKPTNRYSNMEGEISGGPTLRQRTRDN